MSAVAGGAPASAAQAAASAVAEAGAEASSWASSMEGIRRAHIAEADALEKIVSALASKQQSSISALRRQVEAIAARQSRASTVDKPKAKREKPKVADAPLVESRTVADVPDGVIEQPKSTESAIITHTIGDVGDGGEEDEMVLETTTFEEWEEPFKEEDDYGVYRRLCCSHTKNCRDVYIPIMCYNVQHIATHRDLRHAKHGNKSVGSSRGREICKYFTLLYSPRAKRALEPS